MIFFLKNKRNYSAKNSGSLKPLQNPKKSAKFLLPRI